MAILEVERLIVPNAVRTLSSSSNLSMLEVSGVSVLAEISNVERKPHVNSMR